MQQPAAAYVEAGKVVTLPRYRLYTKTSSTHVAAKKGSQEPVQHGKASRWIASHTADRRRGKPMPQSTNQLINQHGDDATPVTKIYSPQAKVTNAVLKKRQDLETSQHTCRHGVQPSHRQPFVARWIVCSMQVVVGELLHAKLSYGTACVHVFTLTALSNDKRPQSSSCSWGKASEQLLRTYGLAH